MSAECCCPSCDARMIELIQAIDDLRRSLVIAIRENQVSPVRGNYYSGDGGHWYWDHG
jgi:hypothetical protein